MYGLILNLEKYFRKSLIIYYFFRKIISFFLIGKVFEKEQPIFDQIEKYKKLTIIDIGVNDGLSSFFFKRKFKDSKIYIFDPILKIPKNKLNNFEKVNQIGLSDRSSKIMMAVPYFNFFFFKCELSAYSTLYSKKKKNFFEINRDVKTFFFYKKIKFYKKEVFIKKLDDYDLKPDLIKIDVEGHENEVIMGSIKTIKKHKPFIFIERPSLFIRKFLKKDYHIVTYDFKSNIITSRIDFKKNRNYLFIPKK